MDATTLTDRIKNTIFTKRTSKENIKHAEFKAPGILVRPLTALSRHDAHQLSDIVEVSGSSTARTPKHQRSTPTDGTIEQFSLARAEVDGASVTTSGEDVSARPGKSRHNDHQMGQDSSATSTTSLPLRRVPNRRSSAHFSHSLADSPQGSVCNGQGAKSTAMSTTSTVVSQRGRSISPVRDAIDRGPQPSEALRPSQSRTFVRTSPPLEVLENGSVRHNRLKMSLRLPSPLFVGGGTVEGQVALDVDANSSTRSKERPIFISKLSIDIIGVEEISDGKRWVFMSLASELFDKSHLPPPALVKSQVPLAGSELWWEMRSSSVVVPFCLNLPLNLGPPPYLSREASIRYLLCPTALIKVGDKLSVVRSTWNIQMLTIHDPAKALASLPNPLLANDTLVLAQKPGQQAVKLTAGLHRQTWVSGGMIFADVHITNNTKKDVKRLEIQLEKTTLWYDHAAAGTVEKSASHLRLPRRTSYEVVASMAVKRSRSWNGVPSHTTEVRTLKLEVPRGHVTISTGRYFEVRYFLNVIVAVTTFKSVSVQLPVTIIHLQSLDILPNSLAQVALSIEARRARTLPESIDHPLCPQYRQGQAFIAPRYRSLRSRNGHASIDLGSEDIRSLKQQIDTSPRRFRQHQHQLGHHSTMGSGLTTENIAPSKTSAVSSSHHHHMHHPSCYHCHLVYDEHQSRSPSRPGPNLPRLQVSTSGLGFSESEFEIPPDSPLKKVMLSEQERKMINQQRELDLQRQWSKRSKQSSLGKGKEKESNSGFGGWNNVAYGPNAMPKQPDFGNRSRGGPPRLANAYDGNADPSHVPVRRGGWPQPGILSSVHGSVKHHRSRRSIDGSRRSLDNRREQPMSVIKPNVGHPSIDKGRNPMKSNTNLALKQPSNNDRYSTMNPASGPTPRVQVMR